jgi:hypothetical protein
MTVPDVISAVIAVLAAVSFMALRARRRSRRPHPDSLGPVPDEARRGSGYVRRPKSDSDQRGDPRGTSR